MTEIRPFLNSDPPGIVEIWRSHPPLRGLMQPMSVALLEQEVFSKCYFDRNGFLVAQRNGQLVGFAHAAFGPTPDRDDLSREAGATCMLMTVSHDEQAETRAALLRASEAYLLRHHAKKIYGGGFWPITPFYLGLYGGSSLPGILQDDAHLDQLYRDTGYTKSETCHIWQRDLSGFRVKVDRIQKQLRREYNVTVAKDQPLGGWWEACVLDGSYHIEFSLVPRSGGSACARATFWDMEPLSSKWGVQAMGLIDLQVDESLRQQGLGTFLLGESLRQLQNEGVCSVECQSLSSNTPARQLLEGLSFHLLDNGTVYTKQPE